jgi:agmatinase
MKDFYPWNFLALGDDLSGYEGSKAGILPIPYEATTSYGAGCRNGPGAIISASRQVETYDHELGLEPCRIGIATLPEIEPEASGPKAMMTRIEKVASEIIGDGKFLMSLGGEHSISAALVEAHKGRFHDLSVLQIDAHTDLRDEYQGSRYSHACVMSRISEICGFVGVGIRSFCGTANEHRALVEKRVISVTDFRKNRDAISLMLSMLTDNVYITFDLDGLDPSLMPAVGTPEPGGLLWEEALEILMSVGRSKNIVGADIVELAPIPGLIHPDFTAARLAYRIITSAFYGRR